MTNSVEDNDFGVRIESDFQDFYDSLSSTSTGALVYDRKYSNANSRVNDLNMLKSMGMKTISLKAVRMFNGTNTDKLVVYTNDRKHCCMGKQLMDIYEANIMFQSTLASKFYTEADGITSKFLQIGSRRFRITLKSTDINNISEGKVTNIEEMQSEFNYYIGLPIFSIDYIPTNEGLLAIDFNGVQNLSKLGMDKHISANDVMREVRKALLAYNKI